MRVHILGKSDGFLSVLSDALYEKYNTDLEINVVLNIPVEDHLTYKFDKIDSFQFNKITSEEWNGKYEHLFLGVLGPATRSKVCDAFLQSHDIHENDYNTLLHPSVVFSKQSIIGNGVFIGPGSVIATFASIGNMTTINRKVSVGHHTELGKYVNLNPGCNVGGRCKIGDYSVIGIGANVLDGLEIGNNSIIGAGSLVVKSIPSNVVAYGVPAKIIRENSPI